MFSDVLGDKRLIAATFLDNADSMSRIPCLQGLKTDEPAASKLCPENGKEQACLRFWVSTIALGFRD